MQNKRHMAKGSKKIMSEKERSLSKSEKRGLFLERNYYSWKEKSQSRKTSRERVAGS